MMQAESHADNRTTRLASVSTTRGILIVLAASAVGLFIVAFGLDGSSPVPTQTQQVSASGAGDVDPSGSSGDGGIETANDQPDANNQTTLTTGDTAVSTADAGLVEPTVTQDTTSTLAVERLVSEVVVQVLNGGGPKGIAGNATTLLKDKGYQTLAAKNAYAEFNGPSRILHLDGYEAEAIGVAAEFGVDVSLLEVFSFDNPPAEDLDPSAMVVVIIGEDGVLVP